MAEQRRKVNVLLTAGLEKLELADLAVITDCLNYFSASNHSFATYMKT